MIERYGVALDWVLERQTATLLVALATLAVTVILYLVIPKGLFPTQDTGLVQGVTVAGQSVSYAHMGDLQQQVAAELVKDPDVASLTSYIGVDGTNTTQNIGRYLINLVPLGQRTSPQPAILERLRQRADSVPGMTLYVQPVQDLTIDANVGRTEYEFALEGPDHGDGQHLGRQRRREARARAEGAQRRRRRAGPGALGLRRHRPRHRRAAGDHAFDGRRRALRRVRPADHLDHLHRVQPVPGDPRGRPEARSTRRRGWRAST